MLFYLIFVSSFTSRPKVIMNSTSFEQLN